ncbi:MAG TPA: carboxypeptidase-like regulatory domain-containing protein, partial [Vicinamibacterales bacterium]
MRARTPGALAVGLLLLSIIALAQSPPRDRNATDAPTGTGRLRGRVVAADTGIPLRRAQVRATSSTIRTIRLTTTDAEGRYEFLNLPAGRYTLNVSKAGYAAIEFGQRRPF